MSVKNYINRRLHCQGRKFSVAFGGKMGYTERKNKGE
jgi:hypothetical protein